MIAYIENLSITYNILIVFVLTVTTTIVLKIIFRYLLNKSTQTKNNLDDAIIKAINTPVFVLLWFIFVYYVVNLLSVIFVNLTPIIPILQLGPIFIITWVLFRFINNIESLINSSNSQFNSDSTRLITRFLKIFILLIIVLTVAQYFGLSITSILTFGGMGGIIVGFAAKDMLSNIFGGLMLQIDKPFNTGDWIRSKEYNFEGTVAKIGWRMTKIITFSKNPVYIPNSIFTTIPIETPSRMSNRRIKETVGIRYDDVSKIQLIIDDIKQYLQNNKDIDQRQTIIVNLNTFNAYSVDFLIYAFTNTKNWQQYHNIKQKVLLNISDTITKHGAEIAFPTSINNISYLENNPKPITTNE